MAALPGRELERTVEMSDDAITCVVVDDHPALIEAIVSVLEEHGIDVLGRAQDAETGLELIRHLRPSIAIVDVRMPGMSGIDLAREVSRTMPETAVGLYTGYGDRAVLVEALDAGARGFILKEAPLDDLVRAVHAIAGGDTYVDPVLAGVLIGAEATEKLPRLTQRERDVLRLLAEGLSNEQAGQRLFISAETVRTHVRSAMAKLDADTRTQAVATAIRRSLIR
jgi:DNA-binding NarL/FixJ family response regulator